jgi:hypothetical protein
MKQAPKNDERGFALLVVFLLAAAVAFALYEEVPRVAFESARDKEQILMDRGNQYKRAIELFYTVNKRYPAELKDLENTNDKRFLRRRYKDPMTGQDEWRLIHTNGAALTDSLVQKPPAQNAANGTPANGIVPGGGPLGANSLNSASTPPAATDPTAAIDPATGLPVPAQTQNAAALRRPSDRGFSAGQPQTSAPNANPFASGAFPPNGVNPSTYDPNDPRTWPPISLVTPTTPTALPPTPNGLANGAQPGTQVIPGQIPGAAPSGIPGQLPGLGGQNPQPTFDPSNPAGLPIANSPQGNNLPPNQISAAPPNNFNQLLSQPPATPVPAPGIGNAQLPPPVQQPGFPSQLPFPQPAQTQPTATPVAAQTPQAGIGGTNPATQFINNQLFSPTQAGTAPGAANGTAGGGIAGVASKFKGPAIKTYKKRTKYQEWEFVFEPTNQLAGAAPAGTQANPNGANPNGLNPNGQSPSPQNNPAQGNSNPLGLMPFGSGAGTSGGFGQGQPPSTQAPTSQMPFPASQ